MIKVITAYIDDEKVVEEFETVAEAISHAKEEAKWENTLWSFLPEYELEFFRGGFH